MELVFPRPRTNHDDDILHPTVNKLSLNALALVRILTMVRYVFIEVFKLRKMHDKVLYF